MTATSSLNDFSLVKQTPFRYDPKFGPGIRNARVTQLPGKPKVKHLILAERKAENPELYSKPPSSY